MSFQTKYCDKLAGVFWLIAMALAFIAMLFITQRYLEDSRFLPFFPFSIIAILLVAIGWEAIILGWWGRHRLGGSQ